jgi:queuine tRNA-ribosyltransferase
MSNSFFTRTTTNGSARRGQVVTPHGSFQTPAFMPVGTSGAVKAMTADDLESTGAEIILGNTYHLYLRPGTEIIKAQGGLAKFNGWNRPTLTDSGGFQIFSMNDLIKVTDDGAEFKSHHDGSRHFFTPEKATQVQHEIGADIIMAFDECVAYPATYSAAQKALERTHKWAARCKHEHDILIGEKNHVRLFGIIQGSTFTHLRTQSAEALVALDFPGYAIGGLAVGESKDEMEGMLAHTIQYLPQDKPRYLMGVGYPEDILMAVSYGIDMFDCVLPTRNARTGAVFTSHGQLVYRNADYANDSRPLDPECECRVCHRYSRAYLRHMYNQSEITGMVLATYHSCWFFQKLMRDIRASIEHGRFAEFRKAFLEKYRSGESL